MGKPNFGITSNPDEVKIKAKAIKQIAVQTTTTGTAEKVSEAKVEVQVAEVVETPKATEAQNRPKFGVSETASAIMSQEATMTQSKDEDLLFGARKDSRYKTVSNVTTILALKPVGFWLKSYVISMVGVIAGQQVLIHFLPFWLGLLLVPINFIVYPFMYALLTESGYDREISTDMLRYFIFGDRKLIDTQSAGWLTILLTAALRFIFFVIEWCASLIIGIIGLIIMNKQFNRE